MRQLICLLCGLLLVSPLFAAKGSISHRVLFSGGTAQHLDLFHDIPWQIKIAGINGDTQIINTDNPDAALKGKQFSRIWLSTTFKIPPSLVGEFLYINFQLEGSMLLRQNNRQVVATGQFQKDRKNELRKLTQDQFAPLFIDDTVQHLSIVYIPRPQLRTFEMDLELYTRAYAEKEIQDNVWDEKDSTGKGLYYLAFGIVFFVFYIFFREKVENLYFSLFCLCAALAFLWDNVTSDVLLNLDAYPSIFCFEFLAIFFCKVLKNKERSRIPLIIISTAALLSFLPAVRYNYSALANVQVPLILGVIYMILFAYVTMSCIYYLVSGIGQKRWEAKTILIFCLVPIAVFIVSIIGFIVALGLLMEGAFNSFFANCLDYFSSLIVYVYPLAAVFILGRRNGLNQKQLIAQVASIQQLSEENLQKEQEKKQILERQNESLEREVALRTAEVVAQKEEIEKQHDELKKEKKKSDDLLLNILPEEIAEELKQKGYSDARLYDNVTVLFADFVDFTKAGESMTPQMLVSELDACFKAFDEIIGKYQIEKIKTIGDAYLAVCGLPIPVEDHAAQIVAAAIEIRDFMALRRAETGGSFEIRIGIHSGPVVAGIVGVKKFAYDIWGDTVNTAARMEQSSDSGGINISEATYHLVHQQFVCTFRGDITAKNKGALKMYYVERRLDDSPREIR